MRNRMLLSIPLLLVLAACGKREPPPPPAPAAPTATAPTATAPAAATAPAPAATADSGDHEKGEDVYKKTCSLCHASGLSGAPKIGVKADWEPRIAQGKPTLYEHAIKGFTGKNGMMPAKGGNTALSDDDVKAAVDYMVSKAQ